ncbi:MAG: N-acetyltransferase [Acidimicrobiia bacterium]|nr:N-acetyltransferase [Acidimicrobiia bacterium]
MADEPVIRDATPADFDRINEIYNWTIVDNHVSFNTEPWNLEQRREWWDDRSDELDCLVAELGGRVVGVSYSSFYRPKTAYRTTAETTVVLDTAYRGRGIGPRLLTALLGRLGERGFHRAIAIVALPNEPSVALHERLGYRVVGTITDAGHKLGRYWDTMIMEHDIG